MSNNVELIPSEPQIKERARAQAREILGGSDVFKAMSVDEQRSIYNSLVQDHMAKEMTRYGLASPMATDSGKEMGYKGYDPGFGGDTRAFNELVDSVDFPKFVADLLKAVFDANISVMKAQTDSYIKLMRRRRSPPPTSSRRSRTTRASPSSPRRAATSTTSPPRSRPTGRASSC